MSKLPPQPILDLLDDFNHAREALVQGLKRLNFSDEQAHAKIMRYQQETQRMYRSFNETLDSMAYPEKDSIYDWKGRKKITITNKDLDTQA